MSTYQALHQGYSPMYNARMVRVSITDEHGQEFWAMIKQGGIGYRETLENALNMLQDAVENGRDPGEVKAQ